MKKYQGHIVDAVHREIFDGELVVDDGRIVQVNRCELSEDFLRYFFIFSCQMKHSTKHL